VTPEQASAIAAVATILDKVGALPIGTLLILLIAGPWVAMYFLQRGQEKRFEAVVRMYEENVKLVKNYEDIAGNFQDLVMYNSQSMARVESKVDSNLFCPIVRNQTK
jgi:hypothetical protein